jgi:uncharacterized protein (DUF1330 family)
MLKKRKEPKRKSVAMTLMRDMQGNAAQRVVVIEFDSVAKALAAHDTPAYESALKALGDGAERDIRIVEGVA